MSGAKKGLSREEAFWMGSWRMSSQRRLGLGISGSRNNLQKKKIMLGAGGRQYRTSSHEDFGVGSVQPHSLLLTSCWKSLMTTIWLNCLVLPCYCLSKNSYSQPVSTARENFPLEHTAQQAPFGSPSVEFLNFVLSIANEKCTALGLKAVPNIWFLGYSSCHICCSKLPTSVGLTERRPMKTSRVYATNETWSLGPGLRADWHVTACIIFLSIAQEIRTPVICYQPQLSKNKWESSHKRKWGPFGNLRTHTFSVFLCVFFFSRKNFKVSTCFYGYFINENSSNF